MIKAIFFDLGGVLLQNTIEEVHREFIEAIGIDLNAFKALYKQHEDSLLTGEISDEDLINILKKEFNLSGDVLHKWLEAYKNVMKGNDELIELNKKLREIYKTGIISNISQYHSRIHKQENLFSNFDIVILSSDVGSIKPHEEIFILATQRAKLKPRDCLFVDDRKAYIETPKVLGFKVIYFNNNQQVFKRLEALGVRV